MNLEDFALGDKREKRVTNALAAVDSEGAAGEDDVDPEPAQARESLPRVCASPGQVPGHRGAQPPGT